MLIRIITGLCELNREERKIGVQNYIEEERNTASEVYIETVDETENQIEEIIYDRIENNEKQIEKIKSQNTSTSELKIKKM